MFGEWTTEIIETRKRRQRPAWWYVAVGFLAGVGMSLLGVFCWGFLALAGW